MGQPGAALVAAALQNVAARLGGHALQKAVLTGALALFWLISSFGHNLLNYTSFTP